MSRHTTIEFADLSANPQMGCDSGCELSPTHGDIVRCLTAVFKNANPKISTLRIKEIIVHETKGRTSSEVFHLRRAIIQSVLTRLGMKLSHCEKLRLGAQAESELKKLYICYAQVLHLRWGANAAKPGKVGKAGYALDFERPLLTPGKVAAAAAVPSLFGRMRPDKPWLDHLPTIIFLSDMGDSFGEAASFEYLLKEVVEVVCSTLGARHIWLWFTKQPRRMAHFARWLDSLGLRWPDNLVPVVSVTTQKTVCRVPFLLDVPAKFRGVSAEPLWEPIDLPLEGIDWCVAGGQSGWYRDHPFELNWARIVRDQCAHAGASFFLKQLGNAPLTNGIPMRLKDPAGGNLEEFPGDLRIRQMPRGFYEWGFGQLKLLQGNNRPPVEP